MCREAAGVGAKTQAFVAHHPGGIDGLIEFPAPAALLAGGFENGVGGLPAFLGQSRLPDRLVFGANKGVRSIAFQAGALTAVEQLIVLPLRGSKQLGSRAGCVGAVRAVQSGR